MNCFAIGDIQIPKEHFDAALASCGLFESYRSAYWDICETRAQFRDVIRSLETIGPDSFKPSEKVLASVRDVDVLFTHHHPVSGALMDAAPKLKIIASARGGVENIDLKAMRERGVRLLHCPNHNAVAVAEYTIGLMICEMRNMARADRALRQGVWREDYPNRQKIGELSDANVGILGFGTIGRLVASRLQAFGTTILAHDPYVPDAEIAAAGCIPCAKETLLRQTDIVTLHSRAAQNQPPVIGPAELAMMKPSAYLINTARAMLVDMDALYTALKEKRLMGAAIDVFATEPVPSDFSLLALDNVTLCNHRGGDTYNSYAHAPRLLLGQLKALLETGKTKFLIE